jgi:uncharacterized protein YbaP (TraB family)
VAQTFPIRARIGQMLRRCSRLLLAPLLLALACSGPLPQPQETGRLFLWEVVSAHSSGSAHLLGSLHVGPPDLRLDGAVIDAFERADTVVVEIDPGALSPAESEALFVGLARLPDGHSLAQVVTPRTWELLQGFLDERSVEPAVFEPLEPWFVAQQVTSILLAEAGYRAEHGVDQRVLEQARGHKRVVALETLESQLALFDSVPLSLQDRMLRELLEDPNGAVLQAESMLDAWRLGDTTALAAAVLAPSAQDRDLVDFEERVFLERNHRMAETLDLMLRQDARWFVVVGAAHMVGEEGIPALLAGRGHAVRQVEKSR